MRAPQRYNPASYDQIEDDFAPSEPQWADVEHDPDLHRPDPVGFTSTAKRIEHMVRHGGEKRRAELTALALSKAGDRYDLRHARPNR